MGDIVEQLRCAVADLSGAGAPFALVGGLAVSVRTEPRLTRDLDFAVAVADDASVEDIVGHLLAVNLRARHDRHRPERGAY